MSAPLDCTGMPCPQPVLKCRQCLDQDNPDQVSILVDNEPAKENVSRYLQSRGYTAQAEAQGTDWLVTGVRAQDASCSGEKDCPVCEVLEPQELQRAAAQTVVFLTSDRMGRGDEELGHKLMGNFLATLPELGPSLWRVVMVNSAVNLACQGHEYLDKVQALTDAGVSLLVCGTCLEFFGLLDKKAVGETTNMLDVVTSLQLADKIIQL